MGAATMGKVLVSIKAENLSDLYRAASGDLPAEDVRALEDSEALIDTGAALLSLPTRYIERLGLKRYKTRRVRTSAGVVDAAVCDAVRLTIQGRDCTVDVLEVPDDCPVLVGQIPLEGLDFVVDPVNRRLIGNPDHKGEHMHDMF